MDEAVQLIVVAVVALAAAMILIFMVRGQSGGFLDFANSQVSDAEDTIEEEQQSESSDENTGGSGIDCDEVENPEDFARCSGGGGIALAP